MTALRGPPGRRHARQTLSSGRKIQQPPYRGPQKRRLSYPDWTALKIAEILYLIKTPKQAKDRHPVAERPSSAFFDKAKPKERDVPPADESEPRHYTYPALVGPNDQNELASLFYRVGRLAERLCRFTTSAGNVSDRRETDDELRGALKDVQIEAQDNTSARRAVNALREELDRLAPINIDERAPSDMQLLETTAETVGGPSGGSSADEARLGEASSPDRLLRQHLLLF